MKAFVLCLLVLIAVCCCKCSYSQFTDVYITDPIPNQKLTYDTSSNGQIIQSLQGFCSPSGVIGWLPTMPFGTSVTVTPNWIGNSRTATWTGLPSSNNEFGPRPIGATVVGGMGGSSVSVKFFFPKYGNNHPNTNGTPNWYYYWEQTDANYGSHIYDASVSRSYTKKFPAYTTWKSFIGNGAASTSLTGCWSGAEGIDFYANICRHEAQHLSDMVGFWGQNSIPPTQDLDGDHLPDSQESSLNGGYGVYNSGSVATHEDHFNYGDDWDDCEDYCMHREVPWATGSEDHVDWAYPGHQYR